LQPTIEVFLEARELSLAKSVANALRCDAAATAVATGSQPVKRGGTQSMSLNTRLDALKERHASLESRIFDEDHRPQPDSETLMRLKIEKLRLKEEMERLRTLAN
jgi:hypothetical protein